MRVQSSLISHNTKNKDEIKSVIDEIRPDIVNTFGKALEKEVTELLMRLSGMADIIDANFSQMKDILEKHKEEMIKVIT